MNFVDTSVKRGDIYYADLSPVVGSEQGGVRPVLIIQNDTGNRYSPTVIAAAITSQTGKAKLPTHIDLPVDHSCGLSRDSVVLLEQVRTLDKKRLRELFSFTIRFISAVALVLTAALFILAPVLMRCFMDNEQIVSDGTVMLRWQVVSMVFVGIVLLITIIFQSAGKALGSFLLSISRQGVVFLVVLMVAVRVAGYSGILASQAIADVITAVFALILCRTLLKKELF